MADIDVGTAYVRIEPTAKGIGNKIEDVLNNETSGTGERVGSKLAGGVGNALKVGLGATAAIAGTAAAGMAALGKTIVSNSKEAAAYGDNVDKMSQKLGLSAKGYQEWDYVLSQSGADINSMSAGLKTLTNKLDDAKNGGEGAQDMFKALGLSMDDLANMSREDVFSAVISGFQGMEDSTERAALANDLFGRSGQELTPLFNTTVEETDKLKQAANDLGMVMGDSAVKDAAAFSDSMDNLSRAFDGAKNQIGAAFMPSLTEVTNGLANLIAGNDGAKESIVNGFSSMGQSIAEAMPRVVDTFGTLVAAVAEIAPTVITSLGDGLLKALPEIFPAVVSAVMSLAKAFIDNLPMIIEVGVQLIGELCMGIAEALPELIPAAIDAILTLVDTLLNNVDMLIDCAVQLVTGLVVGIAKALPVLIQKAPEIIIKFAAALIGAIPQLLSAVAKIMTSFINAIREVFPKLGDVGKNLVDGLKNGIINAWNGLVDKVKDMANNLVGAVKSVFKINSPSKVFAQIGDYCVQGFDDGFEDFGSGAVKDVKSAMEDLSSVATPTFNAEMTASADASKYRSVGGNTSDLYGLLAQYLPLLERSTNVNVSLEGDAQGLFRQVRTQTNQFIKSTGASPFLSPA